MEPAGSRAGGLFFTGLQLTWFTNVADLLGGHP
ncbi:MAG: hypothetical protein JWQ24_1688 [Tardiphaga sp.]|nr:hypothetical protein [Tardiphaga sp.]